MKFKTTIVQTGNNTGTEVSEKILEELNGGKKPLVIVTINNYTYRSAVGKMGDKYMISLSAENRKNANINGGDTVDIILELDTAPRTVVLPDDLQKALNKNKIVKANWDKLAPSKKKAIVFLLTDAKTEETRNKRLEKAIESLK
ncbi:MAG TPA: YdeI/OmpD-associated family protein [Chitinophagaceae bacterium]|nr:YdeI/OmpD-associated family protein [Chitinophagaceae bacterium]